MPLKTILTRETRDLPVPLSKDEKITLGTDLAAVLMEVKKHDEDEKERKKEVAAARETLMSRVWELRDQITSGHRTGPVEVEDVAFHDESVVRTIRKDTGAVVAARAMTPEEHQLPIDFVSPERPDGEREG